MQSRLMVAVDVKVKKGNGVRSATESRNVWTGRRGPSQMVEAGTGQDEAVAAGSLVMWTSDRVAAPRRQAKTRKPWVLEVDSEWCGKADPRDRISGRV